MASLFSVAIIMALSIPALWQILLITGMLAYAGHLYKRHGIRSHPKAWIACHTIKEDQWLLQNKAGIFFAAKLRPDVFVSTWMVVLRWDLQLPESNLLTSPTTNVVLFRVMLPPEQWRQLCCNLRWKR